MYRKLVFLLVLLGLSLSPAVQAANIIFVTGTRDIDADGTQDDTEWVNWLEAQGHTVDFQLDHWATLDAAKVEALEAADLIVVSRGSSSGNYATDAAEIAQWNDITTPMVLMNAYVARSSRWLWVDSTTINNIAGPMMEVQVPEHPVFTGVTLNASNQVAIVDGTTGTGQTSFIGSIAVGDGTLIASTGASAWIVEWQSGSEFYAGSGQTAAGLRMLFSAGTQEAGATPQGAFNLTEEGEILLVNIILYMTGEDIEPGRASDPSPDNEQTDVLREVILGWTPGEHVTRQDVYLGTSLDAVVAADRTNPMEVLISQGQAGDAHDPAGLLDFGQTYYWRVDGFEADGVTIYTGDVWSFTTEPFAYVLENITATAFASEPGAGPENTVNGSGLNDDDQHSTNAPDMWLGLSNGVDPAWIQYEFDRAYKLHEMWVWNYNVMFEPVLGFGLKDVTIEYSVDGVEWMVLADVEFAQATAVAGYAANTTVDLAGVMAKYVRLSVPDNWGTLPQYGLSEVRFLYVPTSARQPQPADGQADVNPNVDLSWRAGRDAASHEVYFSTDEQAVIDGTALVDTVAEGSYDLGALDLGSTYYWKINEIDEAETANVWQGDVWSFSTQEYFVVDDFESYTDNLDAGEAVFQTWVDGWENQSRSTVGYFDAPFTEQTIVHGGGQSMPLEYDNAASPFYAEAERNLGSQDWTANGADVLTLYFQGRPSSFFELASGAIIMGSAGADIWGVADEFRYGYQQLDGDGAIVARVDSLVETDPWVKAGVMIRVSTDVGAVNAMAYVTADGRVGWQYREVHAADSVSTRSDVGAVTLPHWLRLSREGDTITASHSSDGLTWEPMTEPTNPDEPSSLEMPMGSAVLMGLAVTSHSAGNPTTAQFSGVDTTANVTGPWQVATIGPEQAEGNEPGKLYVAVEDNAGHVQVVDHPSGAAATLLGGWQEWRIPLGEFSGVNLNGVKMLYIGIGDRDNPTPGGAGLMYIDDVMVGHPVAQ